MEPMTHQMRINSITALGLFFLVVILPTASDHYRKSFRLFSSDSDSEKNIKDKLNDHKLGIRSKIITPPTITEKAKKNQIRQEEFATIRRREELLQHKNTKTVSRERAVHPTEIHQEQKKNTNSSNNKNNFIFNYQPRLPAFLFHDSYPHQLEALKLGPSEEIHVDGRLDDEAWWADGVEWSTNGLYGGEFVDPAGEQIRDLVPRKNPGLFVPDLFSSRGPVWQ